MNGIKHYLPAMWLASSCLLIGFGAGYMAPAFEQKATLETAAPKATSRTAYARTACLARPILNARGGWSVVFEPGEC